MTTPASLATVLYEAETEWGENVSTFATHRLPLIGDIDLTTIDQQMLDPAFVEQRLQAGNRKIPGPQGGTFKTRMHLPGHGGPTNGAMTPTALETLLKFAFGKLTVGGAGTTISGGTESVPTTTAANGIPAGGFCLVGAGGLARDGRGNGAFAIATSHATNNLTLEVALADTPDDGDIVHSAANLYLPEDASDADAEVASIRLLILTPALQVELHGVYAKSLSFGGFNAGETLYVEIEWGISWWVYATGGTFPSVVASTRDLPATNGAGGFFCADVGDAERDADSERHIKNFSVTVELGIATMIGHDGVSPLQTVIGARRTPSKITWKWQELADSAATTTPILDSYWLGANKHALWESSRSTPGKRVAFYARNLCPSGKRPLPAKDGDLWSMDIEMMAYTGSSSTSALTLAAMILGLA